MARIRTMSLDDAARALGKARAGTHDVYTTLSRFRLGQRDSLGPVHERFTGALDAEGYRGEVALSPVALRQIAGLAGVPAAFLERLPASLALGTLRACLTLALEKKQNPLLLFRLQSRAGVVRLRALLPAGFVRYDDRDVMADTAGVAADRGLRVVEMSADDEALRLRMLLPGDLNLGSARAPDPAFTAIDIVTSECGVRPLEIRTALYRLVCSNGVTVLIDAQRRLRRNRLGIDRDRFRAAFLEGLDETAAHGPRFAKRLTDTRSDFIPEPVEAMRRAFRDHGLGNPRGLAGRLVLHEIAKASGLLGVSRFDFVQAFTRVARELDLENRTRFEDAMGVFLLGREEERN